MQCGNSLLFSKVNFLNQDYFVCRLISSIKSLQKSLIDSNDICYIMGLLQAIYICVCIFHLLFCYREDLKVGMGHASSLRTVRNSGQVFDVAIVIVPATTVPCCLRASSQTTEVCFNFCNPSIFRSYHCEVTN